jgi:hypothetical protein
VTFLFSTFLFRILILFRTTTTAVYPRVANNLTTSHNQVRIVSEATKRREQEIRFFKQTTLNGLFMEVKEFISFIYYLLFRLGHDYQFSFAGTVNIYTNWLLFYGAFDIVPGTWRERVYMDLLFIFISIYRILMLAIHKGLKTRIKECVGRYLCR